VPAGVLIIAVGLLTIAWGHWLLPRRLRRVRQRFSPAARDLYDSRMQRPVARLFVALPLPVGTIAVIIGAVFLLTEV
jgi:ABC-type spermidine/putrescine transport system permease subunit II